MTEGICCRFQSAPEYVTFESPQSASLTAPLEPKGSLWCIRIRIGLSLFASACCNPSGAARQLPLQGSRGCVRNFELFQITREKSRKTEAVFLVGSRRSGGKSKSLRARFLLPAFSFGEAKENAERQTQISNMSSCIDQENRYRYFNLVYRLFPHRARGNIPEQGLYRGLVAKKRAAWYNICYKFGTDERKRS